MWTPEQLRYEYDVIFKTRIGMMCADREPTRDQMDIAGKEAQEAVERLENNKH